MWRFTREQEPNFPRIRAGQHSQALLHLSHYDEEFANKVNEAGELANSVVKKAVLRAVSRVNPKAAKLKKRLLGLMANNSENFSNQAIAVAKKQLLAIWTDDADKTGRAAHINKLEAEKRACWNRIEDLLGEQGAEWLNRLVSCETQILALSRRGELLAETEKAVLEHIETLTHPKEKLYVYTPSA